MLAGQDKYDVDRKVGEGAFGSVFLARRKTDGLNVAIKMMRRSPRAGIDWTALREIKMLQELKNPYVVEMVDVFALADSVNMVMEFCPFDLAKVIQNKSLLLSEAHIKAYMSMTLKGIAAVHEAWILHRDIKPANLLIDTERRIKVADFGLACLFGDAQGSSDSYKVVTLPYRAPELLFGAKEYGVKIDVWSTACVFAELMIRRILMPGMDETDQLGKIFYYFGTPSQKQWPKVKSLHKYLAFTSRPPMRLTEIFGNVYSDEALDLCSKMFVLNPADRPTAHEALEHPWFDRSHSVPPTPLDQLPYDEIVNKKS